jgi:hypothetical protein
LNCVQSLSFERKFSKKGFCPFLWRKKKLKETSTPSQYHQEQNSTVECGLDQSDRNELQPYLENAWSLL